MNTDLKTDLNWLAEYQHPAGGVAYLPSRQPRIEPTALSLLADLARPGDISWLRTQLPSLLFDEPQPEDEKKSSYPADDRPWLVALGIFALCNTTSQREKLNLAACAKFLQKNHAADTEGQTIALNELELAGALPWNVGNYGWVQPTCWGMMAELALLASTSKKNDQERLLSNLSARRDFLLSRKTADHGWNYGNTRVLGVELPAYPLETAMVLTALAGVKNSDIASYLLFAKFDPARSMETLERLIQVEGSRLTHAWSHIAQRCWQEDTDVLSDIAVGPPAVGESSLDAIFSHLASLDSFPLGFQFLQPTRTP